MTVRVMYARRGKRAPTPSGTLYAGHVVRPECKAYNVTTEQQKARYWRQFERRRARWYGAMKGMVAKQFKAELKAIMEAISGAPVGAIENIAVRTVRAHRADWIKFLQVTYLAIGEDFAPAVADSFKGLDGAVEIKADEDPWMRLLLDWINRNAGVKITQIESTTLDLIRRQLSEGMATGESVPQISRRIEELYGRNVSTRSTLIARTEVIGASNAASYMGAKSTGLTLNKQWLSSRDSRTRATHRLGSGVDGQERPMDQPFDLPGGQLMWPGDTSLGASGAETVACRCTITYVRVKSRLDRL